MNRKLESREYQTRLKNLVVKGLKSKNKVLLQASCSAGKTIMTLSIIEDIIKKFPKAKFAICCYNRTSIKQQWYDKAIDFFPFLYDKIQMVGTESSVTTVLPSDINNDTNISLFIPQTLRNSIKNLNILFDYIIIDEAHENLEVSSTKSDGVLKNIIANCSKPTTKYIGLSGTGYKLIQSGRFFDRKSSEIIIYDINDAMRDEAINDCEIIVDRFKFNIEDEFYNKKYDLTLQGQKIVKENAFKIQKIKEIITRHNLTGKTLVIVPRGKKCDIAIQAQINTIMCNPNVAVLNNSSIGGSSKINKSICITNENRFRAKNSGTDFMVVIDKCGTGWDFPELNNVIDLTFTKNSLVIGQRLSRSIRRSKNKPISKYIYCTDESKNEEMSVAYVAAALAIMTKEGINSTEEGANIDECIRIPKDLLNKIKSNDLSDSSEDIVSLPSFSIDDFIKINGYKSNVYTTLKQLCMNSSSKWTLVCEKLLLKNVKKIREVFDLLNPDDQYTSLKDIKSKVPDVFKSIYGNKSVETVMEIEGLV